MLSSKKMGSMECKIMEPYPLGQSTPRTNSLKGAGFQNTTFFHVFKVPPELIHGDDYVTRDELELCIEGSLEFDNGLTERP
jgi:hypothetical protein